MICTGPECDRTAIAKGMCALHRRQVRRGETLRSVPRRFDRRSCSVDGCDLEGGTQGMCRRHYQLIVRHIGCVDCGVICRGVRCADCHAEHRRSIGQPARKTMHQPYPLLDKVLSITDHEQPCRQEPEGWFCTDMEVAEAAAALCLECPLIDACRRAAAGPHSAFGVWAGEIRRLAA